MIIHLAHKIEIKPNTKAKAYLNNAFGVARFVYNWALAMWKHDHCGMELDRDLNASLNLVKLISQIGGVPAELTPEDSTALQGLLAINALATSEVETGNINLKELYAI